MRLDGRYPDPGLLPWPGFALAAASADEHLEELVPLDLWLVTAVRDGTQTVVAAAGAWASSAPPGATSPWQDSFCLRMVERRGPVVAPDVAAAQQQLDTLQWVIPALTGALVAVSSYAGEQQRPSEVARGMGATTPVTTTPVTTE